MSHEPIRLTDAPDAVPVIADPAEPRHQGRLGYGDLRIGQVYLVEKTEAERLIRAKGFALAADAATPESEAPANPRRGKARPAETATEEATKE